MCDGGGLVLNRLIGTQEMDILNPFILLDEIDSTSPEEYSYGFPCHPHRGLQLVTYMLEGEMAHTDSLGNNETLKEGDLQWILAGKGIYHSEMPVIKNEDNKLWVIHYWVTLPKQHKMINPDYQHISSSKVPQIKYQRGNASFEIKVISGHYENYKSPLNSIGITPNVVDIKMQFLVPSINQDQLFSEPISINLCGNSNSFILVLSGSISINQSKLIDQGHFIVFNNNKNSKKFKESDEYDDINSTELVQEDRLIQITSNNNFRIMFFSAEILNEPIVKFGPFAMNSITEIHQCFIDFKGV
ncbi:hypothetical protein DICPUDRAFT_44167 [Dictyostelium purpureum]|uniref:Pirin N-terminal domain-containing protein n=1 Tax=Dictyostelium purpureum TaxID=5786 RepID=F1A5M1_DICPU|nr:uncharacterized protein DICPUDRAFT_44167 [Dictyostelium purpureum]EGC28512.1 hypothetical protein DICPUDRAFT_44167 [Dictyostelium purpureum]|eukprot:XP_003294966.1 hypothetical protein DICPUDRAFT_44167 [Dictyostelium purpureum]